MSVDLVIGNPYTVLLDSTDQKFDLILRKFSKNAWGEPIIILESKEPLKIGDYHGLRLFAANSRLVNISLFEANRNMEVLGINLVSLPGMPRNDEVIGKDGYIDLGRATLKKSVESNG